MSIIRNIKDANAILNGSHKPESTDKGNYVGVEIEMVSPVSRLVMALVLVEHKLDKYVKVGKDGSIDFGSDTWSECADCYGDGCSTCDYDGGISSNRDLYGIELRVLCKESELGRVIKTLMPVLKSLGCEVNESCGLHVHLDMRNRDMIACYKKLCSSQSLLYSVVDVERRDNHFCCPTTKAAYNYFLLHGHAEVEARLGINPKAYDKHGTLEIRVHEGTLDEKEIVNFVKMLLNIIATPQVVGGWKAVRNGTLNKSTINYINKRIALNGKAKLHKKNYVGA